MLCNAQPIKIALSLLVSILPMRVFLNSHSWSLLKFIRVRHFLFQTFLQMFNECMQCFNLMCKKIYPCEPRIINNDKSKRFVFHAYHIRRSKQINNSSGLEVETKFFGLNKLHTCSPNRHASEILSLSRFNLGSQIIKTFITSLLSVFILACPSLLCQNQQSFTSLAHKHDSF